VFLMWIGLNGDTQSGSAIGTGLASMPAAARGAWLLFRVLGAVVTVPVAEELAFRGFLLRRLVASDFESVDLKGFHIVAFVLSSLAFGLMHGDRWIAGSLAGGLYAFVAIRRGRLMEAIVAHATTNALLAIWVVTGNRWYLW
jgi:CAAX prenyl protease-like protein